GIAEVDRPAARVGTGGDLGRIGDEGHPASAQLCAGAAEVVDLEAEVGISWPVRGAIGRRRRVRDVLEELQHAAPGLRLEVRDLEAHSLEARDRGQVWCGARLTLDELEA